MERTWLETVQMLGLDVEFVVLLVFFVLAAVEDVLPRLREAWQPHAPASVGSVGNPVAPPGWPRWLHHH